MQKRQLFICDNSAYPPGKRMCLRADEEMLATPTTSPDSPETKIVEPPPFKLDYSPLPNSVSYDEQPPFPFSLEESLPLPMPFMYARPDFDLDQHMETISYSAPVTRNEYEKLWARVRSIDPHMKKIDEMRKQLDQLQSSVYELCRLERQRQVREVEGTMESLRVVKGQLDKSKLKEVALRR